MCARTHVRIHTGTHVNMYFAVTILLTDSESSSETHFVFTYVVQFRRYCHFSRSLLKHQYNLCAWMRSSSLILLLTLNGTFFINFHCSLVLLVLISIPFLPTPTIPLIRASFAITSVYSVLFNFLLRLVGRGLSDNVRLLFLRMKITFGAGVQLSNELVLMSSSSSLLLDSTKSSLLLEETSDSSDSLSTLLILGHPSLTFSNVKTFMFQSCSIASYNCGVNSKWISTSEGI